MIGPGKGPEIAIRTPYSVLPRTAMRATRLPPSPPPTSCALRDWLGRRSGPLATQSQSARAKSRGGEWALGSGLSPSHRRSGVGKRFLKTRIFMERCRHMGLSPRFCPTKGWAEEAMRGWKTVTASDGALRHAPALLTEGCIAMRCK
jgi:hypothetical protein